MLYKKFKTEYKRKSMMRSAKQPKKKLYTEKDFYTGKRKEIFVSALTNGLGMDEYDAIDLIDKIIDFFGFNDKILDNVLLPTDRDVMYMLEDLELVKTESEETSLPDGRDWRMNTWIWRKENILSYANSKRENYENQTGENTYTEDIFKAAFAARGG
jgi:hypothetical protein